MSNYKQATKIPFHLQKEQGGIRHDKKDYAHFNYNSQVTLRLPRERGWVIVLFHTSTAKNANFRMGRGLKVSHLLGEIRK